MPTLVVLRGRKRLGGTSFGQDGQRIGVEHVLTVPRKHHHEHLVAAVGSFDKHRRNYRHHHPKEALPRTPSRTSARLSDAPAPSASW